VVDGFYIGRPVATIIDTGSFITPPVLISSTDIYSPGAYEVLTIEPRGLFGFLQFDWISDNNPIFTLYAGQADPNDASHFTFRYVAKDGTGTIDGWLLDNDKVRFRALDGPYGHSLSYFTQKEKQNDN
jgi:hypothetical protein